jgi:hypothetical protein
MKVAAKIPSGPKKKQAGSATNSTVLGLEFEYINLEERTLQPLDNPFGPKVLPMS